jgi:hypothetical protein
MTKAIMTIRIATEGGSNIDLVSPSADMTFSQLKNFYSDQYPQIRKMVFSPPVEEEIDGITYFIYKGEKHGVGQLG